MIEVKDLKAYSAINNLNTYTGINPYIKKLKKQLNDNGKIILTETQTNYINDNFNKEPILINRVIKITNYLGEELKKNEELKFVPERILIQYMLAENEKAYHVYGKLTQKQEKSKMYWLPKTQVLDDPYFEVVDIDVDFEKYNDILKKYGKYIYDHQKSGVKFLLTRNNCILSDDMGLGKTFQSIIAAIESKSESILIICPASLKINWKREIEVFCDSVSIVDSKTFTKSKFTIINFDILKNYHITLNELKESGNEPVNPNRLNLAKAKFDLIIVDEAHFLKNKGTNRSDLATDLLLNYDAKRIWLLTGTPVANRPIDFYNLLKIIKSPIADNWKYFVERYCEGRKIFRTLKNGKKKKIYLTDGASNLEELSAKARNIMLRRLKTDVLDMPDKIITPVYYELTDDDWETYDQLWDDYLIKRKQDKKRGNIQKDLVELVLLRKFIAQKAIPETIELTENAMDAGKKVIIFTSFNEEQAELKKYFGKKCVVHNGSMSDSDKQKSVDEFQNNPDISVFIGNTKSAGVGITLTSASLVIFNSFDWVPGVNEQCEDRTYRIGQNKDVIVNYILFIKTISIRMWETLKTKKEIIDTLIGKTEMSDTQIINTIIEEIIQPVLKQ